MAHKSKWAEPASNPKSKWVWVFAIVADLSNIVSARTKSSKSAEGGKNDRTSPLPIR